MLKNEFRAYVAGYFDGEASFCYYFQGDTQKAPACISIESTDYLSMNQIASYFGKHLKAYEVRQKHHKQSYKVKITGPALNKVLHDIMPYLLQKKDQASTLLKLIAYRKQRGSTRKLSKVDKKVYSRLANRLSNQKK